jgi:hypothetical protein
MNWEKLLGLFPQLGTEISAVMFRGYACPRIRRGKLEALERMGIEGKAHSGLVL